MSVYLRITYEDGNCKVVLVARGDRILCITPLKDIPIFTELWRDPFKGGLKLFEAIGADKITDLLENSSDRVLILDCDDKTSTIPWEYACSSDGRFLVCDYQFLRIVQSTEDTPNDQAMPERLVLVCADPILINDADTRQSINIEDEIYAIRSSLESGSRAITAERVPATIQKIHAALTQERGSIILHLSCHGDVMSYVHSAGVSQEVRLFLEDDNGREKISLESDLKSLDLAKLGLVFLNACQTAPLARSLAKHGIPIAIGTNHNIPDRSSIHVTSKFYACIAQGYNIAEALRHARISVRETWPNAVGILTAYVSNNHWRSWELPSGYSRISLELPIRSSIPHNIEITASATKVLGRENELLEIAKFFLGGEKSVVIAGSGGIGKTTLASAFIRRFGWQFNRVYGISFAFSSIDPEKVCRELLSRIRSIEERTLQSSTDDHNTNSDIIPSSTTPHNDLPYLMNDLVDKVERGDLIVIDNFETITSPKVEDVDGANQTLGLLLRIKNKGARFLITSQSIISEIPGSVFITNNNHNIRHSRSLPANKTLTGLDTKSGSLLFLSLLESTPVKKIDRSAYTKLARKIAIDTNGHPFAISLLAKAFNHQGLDPEQFIEHWTYILSRSSQMNVDSRLRTIHKAIDYSIEMTGDAAEKLMLLSLVESPFFAEAAAYMWGPHIEDREAATEPALYPILRELQRFVNLCLLEVHQIIRLDQHHKYTMYRFHPIIQHQISSRAKSKGLSNDIGKRNYHKWFMSTAKMLIKAGAFPIEALQSFFDAINAEPESKAIIGLYYQSDGFQEMVEYYRKKHGRKGISPILNTNSQVKDGDSDKSSELIKPKTPGNERNT